MIPKRYNIAMNIKQRLKNWVLKDLFNATTSTDFITPIRGRLFINGKPLSQGQVQMVARQSTEVMDKSHVVSLVLNELSHIAHEKIYYKDDREFGKAMLYNINLMRNKLQSLSSLQEKK